MKVLVTGGAGFIGANLVRRLLPDPAIDSVVVLDDFSTGFPENIEGLQVDVVEGSILDVAALRRASSGVDAIVHLAACPSVSMSVADPVGVHAINATGTLHVLEAARRRGCYVVLASSSSVYGANPVLPKREDLVPEPVSPYAASKLAAEGYAASYGQTYGLPVLSLRFFNVFGPWQRAGHAYAAVIPAFLARALAGEPATVYGDGRQTRDFTFVGPVTEVLTAAVLRRRVSPTPVNLAFGSRCTLLEVLATLERLLGAPVATKFEAPQSGDVRHSQAATDRLSSLFPDASATSFEEALRQTLVWWQEETARRLSPALDGPAESQSPYSRPLSGATAQR